MVSISLDILYTASARLNLGQSVSGWAIEISNERQAWFFATTPKSAEPFRPRTRSLASLTDSCDDPGMLATSVGIPCESSSCNFLFFWQTHHRIERKPTSDQSLCSVQEDRDHGHNKRKMMDSNPFRPAQRENYEQQLDMSAPTARLVDEADELVDVGLSTSQTTVGAADTQPKFIESSTSSLLTAGGPIGPKSSSNALGGSQTQYSSTGGGAAATSPGIFSRLCGWFSVEYYQPYFDVNSATVVERIKCAASPHKSDIFESTPETAPDLYGAIWIALTLVFLIAASSNLNSYFVKSSSKEPWERDYRLLTFASTTVFAYSFVVPAIMWGVSLYVGVDPRPSLARLVAIYGYCLIVFVPASLLCVIPAAALQWIAVIVAGLWSGVVLIRNLYTVFGASYQALATGDAEAQTSLTGGGGPTARTRSSFALLAAAAALHALFVLLLKLFFFQGAEISITNAQ
jgi:hypothetical protein